jgi:hypothetical protein
MTSADFMRFVIIVSLGVLAFVTFLVAGTIIGLMWLDSWRCGTCKEFPVGLYILGLLGLLLLVSIAMEASEAPEAWEGWIKKNWMTLVIVLVSFITFIIVVNARWWF